MRTLHIQKEKNNLKILGIERSSSGKTSFLEIIRFWAQSQNCQKKKRIEKQPNLFFIFYLKLWQI
jgi:hypothetical protein